MSKVSLRHEMIGPDDPFDIFAMNANGDTHDHVLRSLSYSTIDSEKIRPFEGFKAKAEIFGISACGDPNDKILLVVVKIAVVDDCGIEQFGIVTNYVVCLLRYHACWTSVLWIYY